MMTNRQKPSSRCTIHELTWGLPADANTPALLRLLNQLDCQAPTRPDAGTAAELAGYLAVPFVGASSASEALAALAWCRAVPRLKTLVPEADVALLLDRLQMFVAAAKSTACPLVRQLLGGELALTLSRVLADNEQAAELANAGREVLSAGLIELLDENGLPRAEHLDLLRPLLACWTRVRLLKTHKGNACWSKDAETQYQWLVRGALRLARHDGRHVFSNGHPGGEDAELLAAALKLGGDSDDRRIAAVVLPQARKAPGKAKAAMHALPAASANSEWAATSLMRTDWSREAARLTAAWPGKACRLELARDKNVLLSGIWDAQVRFDGQEIAPSATWEQLCWSSDEDVDYVELELDLGDHLRIQRHIVLAREDRFAFVADAVLGQRSGLLEYRATIPLGPGVRVRSMKESRETAIAVAGEDQAMVMPLALGEWREDSGAGSLGESAGQLQLCQSAEGQRLLAPLWIDLDRKRFAQPLTWRQLTVGEALKPVARDLACGYRVTVGKQTWLVYRSLGPRANRTLLGHNISREMLVAKFDRKGEVHPLIEIE